MEMMALKPERKAELEEYARRRGEDPVTALDDVLATYLAWEGQDFAEATEGIRRGQQDVEAGRTRPGPMFYLTCAANMAFLVELTAERSGKLTQFLNGYSLTTPLAVQ